MSTVCDQHIQMLRPHILLTWLSTPEYQRHTTTDAFDSRSRDLQALSARAMALQQTTNTMPGLKAASSPHRSPVPPQQLGKMRRALETQEEGILQCQQQLALLSAATA